MALHELKPPVPSCVLGLDSHLVNQGAEGVCLMRFVCFIYDFNHFLENIFCYFLRKTNYY